MKKYLADELVRFLEAVDAALDEPTEVVVIGGTAAALHYGVKNPTRDIDTWNAITAGLAKALDMARRSTGLQVPVEKPGIADGPYEMESRFERVLPSLKRLHVRVPEKHDLVLMKTTRAEQHDIDTIAEIHEHSPLDLGVLVDRFEDEMGHVVGRPAWILGNFLAVVERLFPDHLEAVERRLRDR